MNDYREMQHNRSCPYFSAVGPGLISAIMGCTQTRNVIMIPSTECATSACELIKMELVFVKGWMQLKARIFIPFLTRERF